MRIIPKRIPSAKMLKEKMGMTASSANMLRAALSAGFERGRCFGGLKAVKDDAIAFMQSLRELDFIRKSCIDAKSLYGSWPNIVYLDAGSPWAYTLIYDTMQNIVIVDCIGNYNN